MQTELVLGCCRLPGWWPWGSWLWGRLCRFCDWLWMVSRGWWLCLQNSNSACKPVPANTLKGNSKAWQPSIWRKTPGSRSGEDSGKPSMTLTIAKKQLCMLKAPVWISSSCCRDGLCQWWLFCQIECHWDLISLSIVWVWADCHFLG